MTLNITYPVYYVYLVPTNPLSAGFVLSTRSPKTSRAPGLLALAFCFDDFCGAAGAGAATGAGAGVA